jgi:hypothetical protein
LRERWLVGLLISVIISAAVGVSLGQYWNSGESFTLKKINNELLLKLENVTGELESLRKNYTDLQDTSKTDINPSIETRLGIKLMDNGQRYGKYYLWVTGEIENKGNRTAYNVTLLFTLYTNNGTVIKDQMFGTLKPFQVVSVRFSVYTDQGTITGWDMTPVASYEP